MAYTSLSVPRSHRRRSHRRSAMTRFTVRTASAILKGLAYLLGGFLFGVLPLLVVIAYKCLKGGTKVTMWTFGAVIVLIGRVA